MVGCFLFQFLCLVLLFPLVLPFSFNDVSLLALTRDVDVACIYTWRFETSGRWFASGIHMAYFEIEMDIPTYNYEYV